MATVQFGNFPADMRLETSGYGIAPLQNFEAFVDGFVIVREEVVSQTATSVSVASYDASGNSVLASAQGNFTTGFISAFIIDAAGVKYSVLGNFQVQLSGAITGSVSEIRVNLLQDGSLIGGMSGISVPFPIVWSDENLPPLQPDSVYLSGNDVVNGSTGNDYLLGYAGNDQMSGAAGNDTFDGGLGVDTMSGGFGDDAYLVDSAGDVITELAGQGADTATSSVTYALGLNIENLTLTGSAITGTGNAVANSIIGNALSNSLLGLDGDDSLDGGAGADTLNGAAGNDTYTIDNAGDSILEASGTDTVQVFIPYTLGADLENLVLLGSAAYGVGNALANTIIGNSAANPLLRGAGGADTIRGGDGDDWIEGETGNDPFTGVAGGDALYGDNGNDTVLGGDGDDVMGGGAGTDFLIGEIGNDLAYGGSEWDAIDGRQGSDVLYGEGGNDIIFGDGYFYLFGFANDSLFGGDGDDIMMGEAGENSLSGSGDAIYGEEGNDLLDGGGGNDAIYGGNGNDVIDGDHGNDYIVGGQGAEIMLGSNAVAYGGPTTGSDLFVYQSIADAGDSIYGFDTRAGDNDGIDLRPLFDALGYAGTTPRAVGTNLLQVTQSGADALVQIDPDGAAGPQGFTTLLSLIGVSAATVTDSFFLFQ